MKGITVALMMAVAMPVLAQAPVSATVPTAHSVARHSSLTPHKKAVHKKRQMSEAQKANAERMKQCGREWRAEKASGKVIQQKWPQYWSSCNKRLKG